MTDDSLPEALVDDVEESGFVDLDFRLTRLEQRGDGSHLVEGRGRYLTQLVGFALELHSNWEVTPIEDTKDFFYWGAGVFRSIGAESDALLKALGSLYKVETALGGMRPETNVAVVGLANDPRELSMHETRMKLFFESEATDEDYAEIYVNVVAQANRLELHEKDAEYREPLLRRLRAVQ